MARTANVRVRFAPSPTGGPHLGNIRTALFNWLLARATGGSFMVRIEDTDQARKVEGAVDEILAALRWLGVQWDEGPDVGRQLRPLLPVAATGQVPRGRACVGGRREGVPVLLHPRAACGRCGTNRPGASATSATTGVAAASPLMNRGRIWKTATDPPWFGSPCRKTGLDVLGRHS